MALPDGTMHRPALPIRPGLLLAGLLVALLALLAGPVRPALAATITVNTVSDGAPAADGFCTLREAIIAANSNAPSGGLPGECAAGQVLPTVDLIQFAIAPLNGTVKTINVASPLPPITQAVTIDGFTQDDAAPNSNVIANGSNAQLRIELNGASPSAGPSGLVVVNPITNVTIRGLVINRFAGTGIVVFGAAGVSDITIAGNYIGVDPTGTVAQGNGTRGVEVGSVANLRIGGFLPADRNLISGNGEIGILVNGVVAPLTNAVIEGNLVGTNAAGTAALGNATGIIVDRANGVQIGGTSAASRNVISGSLNCGLQFQGSGNANVVRGNLIGTGANGTGALGNGIGICLFPVGPGNDPTNTIIGGAGPGAGNVIANSTTAQGILALVGIGHVIRGNSIFANNALGIDLGGNGLNGNDAGDPDTGPNNLQNFPILTSAATSGGQTFLHGTLNSTPGGTFNIDLYANSTCDGSGTGEGETYVGSTTVNANGGGDGSFSLSYSGGAVGTVYTATATNSATGDTSEFSACRTSVAPAVTVTQSGGTTAVVEGGATDTFDVVLTSQPTADVTITLNLAQVSTSPVSPLTFTAANWNTPQTVTVTAINDAVAEGPHAGSVGFTVNSADARYNNFAITSISVAITDNDTAGITVTPSGGTTAVVEGGATDSFDVVLTSEPTADVTIALMPGAQATTSPSPSLTFTSLNWSTPQTVTVTAVDDAVVEGAHTGSVGFTVGSDDSNYNNFVVTSISVAITDNDSAGVTVTQSGGTTAVTEGAAPDTFDVVLTSQPTGDVTITFNPGTQVTTNPAPTLTFTSLNWNAPRTVTVTAVDDAVMEGAHTGSVAFTVGSGDSNYNNLAVASVTVSITDNDGAGVSAAQSGGSTAVTEGGATDSFTVVLTSQPSADVTITFNPGTQVTTNPAPSLTFTSANWNAPRTVTVTAVDDTVAEGAHTGSVGFTVASSDANYNNVAVASVSVSIADNDAAAFVVSPTSGLVTTEGGGTATFTVRLSTMPTSVVTIPLSSSDTTEGNISPATLTFSPDPTALNSQTVTVTGVDDLVADGDIAYTVVLGAATSTDSAYSGKDPADVGVTNRDDDSPGTVSFSGGSVQVGENAAVVTLTIQRNGSVPASGSGPSVRSDNVPSGSVRPSAAPAPAGGSPVRSSSLLPVSVSYATADGSAIAGQDYVAAAGTLTFGLDETSKRITIPILVDSQIEPNETFTVTLTGPTVGAVLGQATVAVTIVDTSHGESVAPSEGSTGKRTKETEDQRREREHTNRGGRDEIATEGNVIEVRCDQAWPSVVIANRDGVVEIRLIKEAQAACTSIQVGDYLEADGEKQHEQLFDATDVSVKRGR